MASLLDCRNTKQAHLYARNIQNNNNMNTEQNIVINISEEQYEMLLKNIAIESSRDERIDSNSKTINHDLGTLNGYDLSIQQFEYDNELDEVFFVTYSLILQKITDTHDCLSEEDLKNEWELNKLENQSNEQ